MTRLAPTFPTGNLEQGDHEVYNCWQVPGDTPDFIRIYSDPRNLSAHVDILDVTQQCYRWTGLPSGTTMQLSVSCMYPNGDEKSASFRATTTGTKPATGEGTTPPASVPDPVIQNLSVTVQPYLRGVVLEWDALANVGQVDVYYAVVKGGWMGLAGLYNTGSPDQGQHMSFLITPKDHLQYGRQYDIRLAVSALEAGIVTSHEFFTSFTTPEDPRFDDDPARSQRPTSIQDQFKNKSLEPIGELDPDAGPHRRLTPP